MRSPPVYSSITRANIAVCSVVKAFDSLVFFLSIECGVLHAYTESMVSLTWLCFAFIRLVKGSIIYRGPKRVQHPQAKAHQFLVLR